MRPIERQDAVRIAQEADVAGSRRHTNEEYVGSLVGKSYSDEMPGSD